MRRVAPLVAEACNGSTRSPWCSLSRGSSRAIRSATASSAAPACSNDCPGASRPTTCSQRSLRSSHCAAVSPMGRQKSTTPNTIGASICSGITPITVTGSRSTWIVRPMIARSPPNRVCQSRWLINTTALPGRSSASLNQRPSSGGTPSVGKKSAVARTDTSISAGRPGSVRLAPHQPKAASRSNPAPASRTCRRTGAVSAQSSDCGVVTKTRTRSPPFGYGSGRRSSAFIRLNIEVFSPMPRASVSSATRLNPGAAARRRRAKRRSAIMGKS